MVDLFSVDSIKLPDGVTYEWLVERPITIVVLILIAVVARWLAHRVIKQFAKRIADGRTSKAPKPDLTGKAYGDRRPGASARRKLRAETIGDLLSRIVTAVIIAIAFVMILAEVGLNIAPLLAGAGIIGVAIGFGAQSLVKDLLSGIFMTLEDQYGVGDSIDVGEATGTVEAVGLRVTRMRDTYGTVWYVRNGEIVRVGNMSQNWARTVLDVPVPYESDFNEVQELLRSITHEMWEDEAFHDLIIAEPDVWGVQSFENDGVLIRLALKTGPSEQWAVGRELRERILVRFATEGITIPHIEYRSTPYLGSPEEQ